MRCSDHRFGGQLCVCLGPAQLDQLLGQVFGSLARPVAGKAGVELFGGEPDGPLETLAGETGTVDAAEYGGLGRADVVAVEAGDGDDWRICSSISFICCLVCLLAVES